MLSDDQLREIIAGGENSTVEFKNRISQPDLLAKLIAGFANAEGGFILVGVDDRGGVLGIDSQDMMRIYEETTRRLKDASSSSMYFHSLEGREIAVVRIAKAPRIVSTRDGVYVRRGAVTTAMSSDELQRRFEPQAKDVHIVQILEIVTDLSRSNETLRAEIISANSFRGQLRNYILGGLIGALISAVIALLVKWT